MKPSRILIVAVCSIIICAMFSGLVSALNQDEATASVHWSPQSPLPGSTATVTIFFINSSPDTLTIQRIGLHFDWMAPDGFDGLNLSNDPVTVPSQGTHTFNPMLISIPTTASLGTHRYYVGIDGIQGASTVFSWDSPELMLLIGGSGEQTYNTLKTQVATKLSATNYQSSEAKSLKNQAETKFDQAAESAKSENWAAAIASLQDASSLLAQADAAEQNYTPTQGQNQLIIIVGVAAAAVVAVLVVIFMVRRKKKKQPQTPPAAPTTPAEQPSYDI